MKIEPVLKSHPLFQEIEERELESLIKCLRYKVKEYGKGEIIYKRGEFLEDIGIVLKGKVFIETVDERGNKDIFSSIQEGETFGEAYALTKDHPLMVDVVAGENCQVFLLNGRSLLDPCRELCQKHIQLHKNVISLLACKNMVLSRKIINTSSKTIRGRLNAYLLEQETLRGSREFTIPYDRQGLADYLSVDRSQMSKELSKMKKEGLIDYRKNSFKIKK